MCPMVDLQVYRDQDGKIKYKFHSKPSACIKEAIEKYERMCKVEEGGGRPIHQAREWQLEA